LLNQSFSVNYFRPALRLVAPGRNVSKVRFVLLTVRLDAYTLIA
jgi:hypothetical protein